MRLKPLQSRLPRAGTVCAYRTDVLRSNMVLTHSSTNILWLNMNMRHLPSLLRGLCDSTLPRKVELSESGNTFLRNATGAARHRARVHARLGSRGPGPGMHRAGTQARLAQAQVRLAVSSAASIAPPARISWDNPSQNRRTEMGHIGL